MPLPQESALFVKASSRVCGPAAITTHRTCGAAIRIRSSSNILYYDISLR